MMDDRGDLLLLLLPPLYLTQERKEFTRHFRGGRRRRRDWHIWRNLSLLCCAEQRREGRILFLNWERKKKKRKNGRPRRGLRRARLCHPRLEERSEISAWHFSADNDNVAAAAALLCYSRRSTLNALREALRAVFSLSLWSGMHSPSVSLHITNTHQIKERIII